MTIESDELYVNFSDKCSPLSHVRVASLRFLNQSGTEVTVPFGDLKSAFDNTKTCCPPIPVQENDPWKNRSAGMRCRTCMYFAVKTTTTSESKAQYAAGQIALAGKYGQIVGRCRRHSPTMNGYPVVFEDDWCGDHKLDESKI